MISMTVDISQLKGIENAIHEDIWHKIEKEVANNIIKLIKQKTSQGIDYLGDTFKPYTKSYANYRHKKGLQSNSVDLKFTGKMLNGIFYNEGDSAIEFTTDRIDIAYYVNNKRQFFAVELMILNAIIDNAVKLILGA